LLKWLILQVTGPKAGNQDDASTLHHLTANL